MGKVQIEWTKGDACKVAGQEFPLGADLPSMREVADAARTLKEYAEGWAMLRKAELSFETGGASYENAWVNARNLKAGIAQADHDLRNLYGGIASYFHEGRSPFGAVPEGDYLALAAEVLRKLREVITRPKPKPAAPPQAVVPAMADVLPFVPPAPEPPKV